MAPDNNRRGPKEIDNGDKSLRGLMVALALAGAIAGSVILFAYASSDGLSEAAGTAGSEAPEPVIVEKVVEKPVYIERIKYINRTVEVEKPVYINRTVEVEKEVPVYIEKEKPVYIYVNNTDDNPPEKPQSESDREDRQEKEDDSDMDEQDTLSKCLRGLLDGIVDLGDDDEKDDDDDEKRDEERKHGDEKNDDD